MRAHVCFDERACNPIAFISAHSLAPLCVIELATHVRARVYLCTSRFLSLQPPPNGGSSDLEGGGEAAQTRALGSSGQTSV